MDTTPTARTASRPRRRRLGRAVGPARLARGAGLGRRGWPRRAALAAALGRVRALAAALGRVRALAPDNMDPLHLWLVLLLAAVTLASGLATLAEALHWA